METSLLTFDVIAAGMKLTKLQPATHVDYLKRTHFLCESGHLTVTAAVCEWFFDPKP